MDKIELENPTQFEPYIEDLSAPDGLVEASPFDKGYWMAWQVGEKDPFDHFLNKYGREVREVGIGQKVQIEIPDGVKVLEMKVPVGQIWLR